MARTTVLQEVREALEPGFRGNVTTRPGEQLDYHFSYDSVLHFLGNAYTSMTSPARKKKFREAISTLFAERIQKSGGSAALVLGLVAITGAYDQLPKIVRTFNKARLTRDEANVLLYDLLATLKGTPPTESTYEVLRQLVNGPKFDAGYAIEALQMELECYPGDCRATLYRYASLIQSLCQKVKRTRKQAERDGLRFAFDELQSLVSRLHLEDSVQAVFDEQGVPHGKWPELIDRIVSNRVDE